MKETVHTDAAPAAVGAYSQATTNGDLVFTAGQIPLTPDGDLLDDASIAEQTEQALDNLVAVLDEAGADPADVLKTTVFRRHRRLRRDERDVRGLLRGIAARPVGRAGRRAPEGRRRRDRGRRRRRVDGRRGQWGADRADEQERDGNEGTAGSPGVSATRPAGRDPPPCGDLSAGVRVPRARAGYLLVDGDLPFGYVGLFALAGTIVVASGGIAYATEYRLHAKRRT